MCSSPLEHDPQRRLVRQPRVRSEFFQRNFPPIVSFRFKVDRFGITLNVVNHLNPTRTCTWRPQNKNKIDLDSESGAHVPIRHTFPRTLYKRHPWGNLKELLVGRLVCRSIDRWSRWRSLSNVWGRQTETEGYGVLLDYDTASSELINQLFLGKGSIYNRAAVRIPFQFGSSSEFVERCLESIRNIFSNIWSEKVTLIVHFKWTVDQFEQFCCILSVKELKKSQNVYQSLRLPDHQYTKVSRCLQMWNVQVILTNNQKLSQN